PDGRPRRRQSRAAPAILRRQHTHGAGAVADSAPSRRGDAGARRRPRGARASDTRSLIDGTRMTHDSLRVGHAVWPHASLGALLDGCEVLVCSASLEADDRTVRDALAVLDPTERERFESYENADVARR